LTKLLQNKKGISIFETQCSYVTLRCKRKRDEAFAVASFCTRIFIRQLLAASQEGEKTQNINTTRLRLVENKAIEDRNSPPATE